MPEAVDGAQRRVITRPGVVQPLRYIRERYFVTVDWVRVEAIGRREVVVESAVRARAGEGLGGVGASDVAGVLAGRPDPGGADGPGGRVGEVTVH